MRNGDVVEVVAQDEFCIRAGNAGALTLILNDEPIGLLGQNRQQGSWFLRSDGEPEPAPGAC